MRVTCCLLKDAVKMLDYYSSLQPRALTMKQYVDFGKWEKGLP